MVQSDNRYKVGDVIQYRDIDVDKQCYEQATGYILHIKKDGSYIVGNIFVPYEEVTDCMCNPKHPLNRISFVSREDLSSELGYL